MRVLGLQLVLTTSLSLIVGGCFSPDLKDGGFRCNKSGECPSGFTCVSEGADKVCRKDGSKSPDIGLDGPPSGEGIVDMPKQDLGSDGPVADGPVADGPVADGPVADGPVADGPVADGPVADGSVADGPVLDGPTNPDTMQPDTMQPDTMQPDTMQPDTMQPDTMQPDSFVPPTVKCPGAWPLRATLAKPQTADLAFTSKGYLRIVTLDKLTRKGVLAEVNNDQVLRQTDINLTAEGDALAITMDSKDNMHIVFTDKNGKPYWNHRGPLGVWNLFPKELLHENFQLTASYLAIASYQDSAFPAVIGKDSSGRYVVVSSIFSPGALGGFKQTLYTPIVLPGTVVGHQLSAGAFRDDLGLVYTVSDNSRPPKHTLGINYATTPTSSTFDEIDSGPPSHSSAIADSSGVIHIAYVGNIDPTTRAGDLFYVRYSAGTRLSNAYRGSSGKHVAPESLDIALDSNGNPVYSMRWINATGSRGDLRLYRSTVDGSFSSTQIIDPTDTGHFTRMATFAGKVFHLVYLDLDGATTYRCVNY